MTTGQELHKLRWIYDGASMPSGGKAEVESSYMSRAASADPVSAALAPGNVSVMQGDADPGTLPPNVASSGRMAPAVSEAALYAQLTPLCPPAGPHPGDRALQGTMRRGCRLKG